jgi:hypothetical protein
MLRAEPFTCRSSVPRSSIRNGSANAIAPPLAVVTVGIGRSTLRSDPPCSMQRRNGLSPNRSSPAKIRRSVFSLSGFFRSKIDLPGIFQSMMRRAATPWVGCGQTILRRPRTAWMNSRRRVVGSP